MGDRLSRFWARQEVVFFRSLTVADRRLGMLWWALVVVRSILPAVLAVTTGAVVGAVQSGNGLTSALVAMGVVFVTLQVSAPLHQAVGENLGNRFSAWLYDKLTDAVRLPAGIGHLEDPELTSDLAMAREFDNGIAGPPMEVALPFIAVGLVDFGTGVASAVVLVGLAWWAPLVLGGAWLGTHWLLRESAVWQDRNTDEVRDAAKHADYAYRLAVDPPSAKELRMFGLGDWTVDRFLARRIRLYELQARATRIRERPLAVCGVLVTVANLLVFGFLAVQVTGGRLPLGGAAVYAQVAVGVTLLAFGGLNWALDGAAAPTVAVLRLEEAAARAGALQRQGERQADGMPAREIRLRGLGFTYPRAGQPVFEGLDLSIPAGTSLAIVGQNGAG